MEEEQSGRGSVATVRALRDVIAFIAVMNKTIRRILRQKGIPSKRSKRCIGHGASQFSYSLRFGSAHTLTPASTERVVICSPALFPTPRPGEYDYAGCQSRTLKEKKV